MRAAAQQMAEKSSALCRSAWQYGASPYAPRYRGEIPAALSAIVGCSGWLILLQDIPPGQPVMVHKNASLRYMPVINLWLVAAPGE